MAQNISNLLHRRSGIDEAAAQGVSQDVDPRSVPSASSVGSVDCLLDDASADRLTKRRNVPYKDRPAVRRWSFMHKIVGNCRAGGCRQRQNIGASRLAGSYVDRSGRPIDVVEAQPNNFTASEAQIG
ncbi:hypothetical protein SPHINGOT1_340017 [Sphingomonas sp. T1]|nr:hypothetical protein SPHINGOT1_340017 [Sphingomonas sp. T1]